MISKINNLLKQSIEAAILAGNAILTIYNSPTISVEIKSDQSPLTEADKLSHITICRHLEPIGIPILSEEGKHLPFSERKHWKAFWLIDPLDGTKEFIKRNGEFTVNIALIENQKPILGVIFVPTTGALYYADYLNGAFKVQLTGTPWISKFQDFSAPEKLIPHRKKEITRLVASRSHLSTETIDFAKNIEKQVGEIEIVSIGSSLKFCLLAEGKADIYPRFGPTMEWDTAAGHAIAEIAGCNISQIIDSTPLIYNKETLLNPWFIVKNQEY